MSIYYFETPEIKELPINRYLLDFLQDFDEPSFSKLRFKLLDEIIKLAEIHGEEKYLNFETIKIEVDGKNQWTGTIISDKISKKDGKTNPENLGTLIMFVLCEFPTACFLRNSSNPEPKVKNAKFARFVYVVRNLWNRTLSIKDVRRKMNLLFKNAGLFGFPNYIQIILHSHKIDIFCNTFEFRLPQIHSPLGLNKIFP